MKKYTWVGATASTTALLLGGSASAQDAPAAPPAVQSDAGGPAQKGKTEAVAKPDDASDRPQGLTPGIAFGATFNLNDTRSVVGQQDGTAFNLGAAIDASLDFNEGVHEWRNSLKLAAGVARTPSIDEFVKTNDGLALESIYLLHAIEVFGPYARFALQSQMFPALDIRPAATDYEVSNLDGTKTSYHGRRLYLTDPFHPFTFKESIGAFVQPIKGDPITFEGRAGLAARETLAKGSLAINDDAATPVTDVKELDDNFIVGGEVVANAWGFFDEDKRVAYTFGVGVLFPFVTSDLPEGDERGLGDLITVEGLAGLNVKLFDWASLGYKLQVVRDPVLVDSWQVSNSLLLTIGAAFGSKAPAPPPPPPPCDCPKPEVAPPGAAPSPPPAPPPPASSLPVAPNP